MNTRPTYSIVIPAFNESERIEFALQAVVSCVRSHHWNAEIIVVDDGSTDSTAADVLAFASTVPAIRLVQNAGNRGKGYSVRHGFSEARGEILLFTDADLSAPIREAEHLFAAIRCGADIAIGSRWLPIGAQSHPQESPLEFPEHPQFHPHVYPQPAHRRLFAQAFNWLTRKLTGLRFTDTQCGFKAFTRQAAQAVFELQAIERWSFDPEILLVANRQHLCVREVPVTWGHDERSFLSYIRDGLQMLPEILAIRWYISLGRYNQPIRLQGQHS